MFAEGGMLVLLDREVLGSVVPQDAFRELCNTLQFQGGRLSCSMEFISVSKGQTALTTLDAKKHFNFQILQEGEVGQSGSSCLSCRLWRERRERGGHEEVASAEVETHPEMMP